MLPDPVLLATVLLPEPTLLDGALAEPNADDVVSVLPVLDDVVAAVPVFEEPVPPLASEPDATVLVELFAPTVEAALSEVVFALPVPLPPATLELPCDPAVVEAVFALPVPSPPPVAVPAAEPFVPVEPEPEPSVSLPAPSALVVPSEALLAAVLVADEPPAPSLALRVPPDAPPLDTAAPLPAEPPLSADDPEFAVELLSPEFSFDCELDEPLPAAAVCLRSPALP